MSRSDSARILLLQDNAALAHLAAQHLVGAGFRVFTPRTSRQALDVLAAEPVDLLVLDTRLPDDTDGLEFCRALRAAGYDLPVVLLLDGSHEVLARAQEAGVHEILPASAEHIELLAPAIARLLSEQRTHRQLLDSDHRFQALADSAPVFIWMADETGRWTFASHAWLDFTGRPLEQELGFGWLDRVHPGDLPRSLREYHKGIENRAEFVMEHRAQRQDGEYRWMLNSGNPRLDAQGTLLGYIGCAVDISERKQVEQELRQSEERYRRLLETSPDGVLVADGQATLLMANPQAATMLGYDQPQDLIGMNGLDLPAREERPRAEEDLRRLLHQERLTGLQYLLRRKDGSLFPAEISAAAFGSQADKTLLGIVRDVSSRKDAEEQLRLFRTAVEQESSSIVLTDARPWPAGPRIQFVNAAFVRMSGIPVEEAVGQVLWTLWGREHDQAWIEEVEGQILRGEPFFGAGAFERKDGTTIHMGWHINPIRDSRGAITHFVSIQRDISERHRIQEQIREQAALLEQVREAIILTDLDGRIIYWSRGAERMYGWRTAEALGVSIRDLLFQNANGELEAIVARLLADGEWEGEFRQVTRAAHEIIVESRLTLLRHEDGRPRAQLAVNTDVTDKKKLQTQTLRAQRLESIGTLAGGIAHDLNNVLTPLLLGVEVLQSTCQEASMKLVLDSMQKSVRRGADMVKQILLFARGLESRPMPLQLRHLLGDVEKLLKHTLPKSIEVRTQVPHDLWLVMGDLTQLHQVLMNLCVNARDAMPAGGSLTITAENARLDERFAFHDPSLRPGKYVVLHVVDTGTGIPEEHRDRIFDPFFTTKEPGKGTGLGLSTVLGIVQTHNGFIRSYSEPGRGTRFSIYLPALERESDVQKKATFADVPLGRSELVLVVDDEQSIRAVLKATLESFGYRVLLAADGRDAVTTYSQHQGEVRAVVTDMMMPGMDGPELVRTLRHLQPGLKIIGMSGLPGNLPVDLAGRPVDAMLQKPCLARDLLIAVRKVLGSA